MSPGSDSLHFPVLVPLDTSQLHRVATLVAVPRDWEIETGTFAGSRVRVSMEQLAGNPLGSAEPWVPGGFGVNNMWVIWPGLPFPKRLFFDEERSDLTFLNLPSDSAALWATIDSVEQRAGFDLFDPGNAAQAGEGDVVAVSVRLLPRDFIWSHSSQSVRFGFMVLEDFRGRLLGLTEGVHFRSTSWVSLRSGALLRNVALWEELALILHGFWNSTAPQGTWCRFRSKRANCPALVSARYSVEDAAAIAVTHALGRATFDAHVRSGSALHPIGLASLFGERAEWLGLDPVPTRASLDLAAVTATREEVVLDETTITFGYEDGGREITGIIGCSELATAPIPEDVRLVLIDAHRGECGG